MSMSGIFKLLSRLLPWLYERARGRKVLIFSQMTELLDILQDFEASLGLEIDLAA